MPESKNRFWVVSAGILVFLVLGVGIYYYFTAKGEGALRESTGGEDTVVPDQATANFSQEGNLARNNPGMKPNAWYLVYDEPGAPGRSVELVFTERSLCTIGEISSVCSLNNIVFGARVAITGFRSDSQVWVHTYRQIDLEEKG